MEIAFFTDSYEPMRDGVAAVTAGLARALVRLGHSVQLFAPDVLVGARPREDIEDGVRVRRIRSVPVPLYTQYRWPVFPFGLLREVRGSGDADVIHIHTPGVIGSMGFLAARRFGRPLVGTFHTNLREMEASVPRKLLVPLFFRIAWWYNLGTYRRCNVTTTPSRSARDALKSSAKKPFRGPIEVVPNGIDVQRFHPGARLPDWRLRCGLPAHPLVTYLGRLTVDKGVFRFLDAVAEATHRTDLVAIVGGTGPEASAVTDRLARDPFLRKFVRYVGPVAEEEKAALLAQSDVFVLPSTSDTASVALLEAMACGAAVIAPDQGGASEVVEDGVTGRRVDVGNPQALAGAVAGLVESDEERRQLSTIGARWARENASLDTMAGRFISLYRMVAAEGRPRADRFTT
jgi:glycosyltransferase involved in cell wall biosynthesis